MLFLLKKRSTNIFIEKHASIPDFHEIGNIESLNIKK